MSDDPKSRKTLCPACGKNVGKRRSMSGIVCSECDVGEIWVSGPNGMECLRTMRPEQKVRITAWQALTPEQQEAAHYER